MTTLDRLLDIVARNRAGQTMGIPSWCTAHPDVLRVVLHAHRGTDDPILIEATCNQVNQHGGYTGMTPAAFRDFVFGLAREEGVPTEQVLLGGDHLGPNPWRSRPAGDAMAEARAMVRAHVEAGFTKIHLDASMHCADDGLLDEGEMAVRAADLCSVAECHAGGHRPVYVVGTEVPVPGGEASGGGTLRLTRPEAMLATFARHSTLFPKAAAERIIGIVVQPGVDFGNNEIWRFDARAAASLAAANIHLPGAVFEAHSTDYQTGTALRGLVSAHFGILKVGPELTFAYREAVMAMAHIERHLSVQSPSRIVEAIEVAMAAEPKHWQGYVVDGPRAKTQLLFGLSDRVRYYWPDRTIAECLGRLYANIDAAPVDLGLISQFAGLAPEQSAGGVPLSRRIIAGKVGAVVAKYRSACAA
jgi:D-tagatose-1,6-bisphosphate aldolase subunit GatZ/KbaZ